jgi:hypothetical protein
MITAQEQQQICFLSDTTLYEQAREFMRNMGGPLSQSQINGLLNVSLNNTYAELNTFIADQMKRAALDEHIRNFYTRLQEQLRNLDAQALSIISARAQPSPEDLQTLKMLLAREFIQHVLAENAYKGATRSFPPPEHAHTRNQDRPRRNQRGPAPQQGGQRS